MTISFASKDGIYVNQHFGWCDIFYKYKVDKESFSFVKKIDASKKITKEMDMLAYKISCLERCDIVCVSEIGPKAISMIQKKGIFAMKSVSGKETIEDILKNIQKMLRKNPPLWLKRIEVSCLENSK